MIHSRIIATGSYLPGEPVTNDDLVARGIDTSDQWIVERTGIRSRHLAADGGQLQRVDHAEDLVEVPSATSS